MLAVENVKDCFDLIEDGLIVVDRDKIIQIYNNRAQEIFGLKPQTGPGHSAGMVTKGDIIILGDTCLGVDDGALTPKDLEVIGIPPQTVRSDQALIAVGKYESPHEPSYYKVAAGGCLQTTLSLSCCINKRHNVTVSIDNFARNVSIKIDGKFYDFSYQICIGHMVIVSGATGQVKFYQSRGYTARGEDIRKVLLGKKYLAKGPGSPSPEFIGQPLDKIHPDNKGTYYLDQILSGRTKAVREKEYTINGIWVRASAFPLYNHRREVVGGALVFRDINELKKLEWQVQHRGFKYPAFDRIKGTSPEFSEAINVAQRVSGSQSTVLLLGESGTGKGMFAKAIHDSSPRANGPFIIVNIAAIPSSLLESELFGYEDGAFTGAKEGGAKGKLRLANGGTIFLDEIGEMDFHLQAKILHVLQEDYFYPVGSSKPVKIDVRFIAATNRNLEEEVKNGGFRKDLYYRLNVVSITLPPLRRRKADIRELVDRIFPQIKKKVGRSDVTISAEIYEDLLRYDWPGNIRELENVLEWTVNIATGSVITRADLPDFLKNTLGGDTSASDDCEAGTIKESVMAAERDAIMKALETTRYNRSAAMKILRLGRTAFYEKIKQYRIPLNTNVR